MIWYIRHLLQLHRTVATCAVVLILISTTASSSSVLGQNTLGTPLAGKLPIQATPRGGTPAAGATPIAQALPAEATPVPGSAMDTETFRAFGYEDVTAQGMHANTVMSFPLPRGSGQSAGGQLDLLYSHSPLLVPELSTMTVIINDRTMTSVRLEKETQDGGRLSIPLPAAGSSGDPLVIRFAFHLRLTKDQCAILMTLRSG